MAIYSVIGEEKSFALFLSLSPISIQQGSSLSKARVNGSRSSPRFRRIQRFRTGKSERDFYRFVRIVFCRWVEGNRRARDNGVSEKRGSLPGGCRATMARQFAGERFGDEAEEGRVCREQKARDTEGEGWVGRFPLSTVNTAHGRRYNWRRRSRPLG